MHTSLHSHLQSCIIRYKPDNTLKPALSGVILKRSLLCNRRIVTQVIRPRGDDFKTVFGHGHHMLPLC